MNTESSEVAFRDAYGRLNKEQKRAVDAIEGPVMVVAGPGTGKTQILTLRIANILLKTDTRPENILALTFTESGAAAMRARLLKYIGRAAYRVNIHTFHGFAETLIRAYPDAYPRVVGGRPARDLEKVAIIEAALASGGFKILLPSGNLSFYVKPILGIIGEMKRENITPDKFAAIIKDEEDALAEIPRLHEKGAHKGKVRKAYADAEKNIAKNRELLAAYRLYESALADAHLYDFEDMILETVAALRDKEDMRLELQETYQYVLADEHQDVNGSQNAILEHLTSYHERPNIFVVGDEKQSIFRFQGASLENFLFFEDKFVHAETIVLTKNYRSGQEVLDAAHELISTDAGVLAELRVPLVADTKESAIVELREFSHEAVEDEWLLSSIAQKVEGGVDPCEIAIIVRTNVEVERFAGMLRARGVAARASADGDILTHPLMNAICGLLDAAISPAREDALFSVLHGAYWGIPAADLVRVLRARTHEAPLAQIIRDRAFLEGLGVADVDAVMRVGTVIDTARDNAAGDPPQAVLAYLLHESGFLAHTMTESPQESGRVIRRIYDEVESLVNEGVATLGDAAKLFERLRSYNLPLRAPYVTTHENAVQVMTAHKSKGLEFDHVYVPHLIDSKWGGARGRTNFKVPLATRIAVSDLIEGDDERRLLYVAMTRARSELLLSYGEVNAEGKDAVPSRLIAEQGTETIVRAEVKEAEASFDVTSAIRAAGAKPAFDRTIFLELLKERGLSATSFNNYLASPWTYIYRNALRVPEVKPEHMLYGTALHEVLERATRAHTREGSVPSDTEVKRLLDRALSKLPLTDEAYVRRHEQGFAALTAYLRDRTSSWSAKTHEEYTLKVSYETGVPELPIIPLTGKLDRVDLREDGSIMRVVDYKSGKAKSRNEILGLTKSSDGNYKRQLVFYALLLSLQTEAFDGSIEYALSFIEPDARGNIREESFTVTEEEIEELKHEIARVVTEIASGAFLDALCDPRESDYCDLAEQLLKRL